MEFLRQQPIVSLVDGDSQTFIADFPQPRPEFDHAKLWSETCKAAAIKKIKECMQRKNSAVSYIQVIVDQHGVLAIITFQHSMILGAAKTAAKVLFRCLPFDTTSGAAEKGLRPMDEVDADRIQAWQTVATLRPAGKKRAREEADSDDAVRFVKRSAVDARDEAERGLILSLQTTDSSQSAGPKSAAQLLAELSDESGSEEEVAPPRLMLANEPAEQRPPENPVEFLDPTSVWEHRIKGEAVLVMAAVGEAPAELQYRRCHHESRRQLLIQNRVRNEYDKPGMVQVMRVAMRLAQTGCMPGPGNHGRKSDFIKTCATALQALDPSKETDPNKLTAEEQALVRHILGGNTSVPYDGCLSAQCLDEKTVWAVDKVTLPGESSITVSRCAKCNFPKAFGRTVHGIGDLFRARISRDTLAGR